MGMLPPTVRCQSEPGVVAANLVPSGCAICRYIIQIQRTVSLPRADIATSSDVGKDAVDRP